MIKKTFGLTSTLPKQKEEKVNSEKQNISQVPKKDSSIRICKDFYTVNHLEIIMISNYKSQQTYNTRQSMIG